MPEKVRLEDEGGDAAMRVLQQEAAAHQRRVPELGEHRSLPPEALDVDRVRSCDPDVPTIGQVAAALRARLAFDVEV